MCALPPFQVALMRVQTKDRNTSSPPVKNYKLEFVGKEQREFPVE
jgi:hypothetical protein